MKDELAGKRVVILGLARQGKALARFAAGVGARVVISDIRLAEQLGAQLDEAEGLAAELVLGGHPVSLLDGADVLAISGGVPADAPIVQAAHRLGIQVTNDSLEFMRRCPATVVGITGSAGKTTTTALTGEMLRAAGRTTWVGGNIGNPLISELDRVGPEDVVVIELSSFQLELWDVSPPAAAVLNVTPNHLDRHGTMETYASAKANILRYQSPSDVAVLSWDDLGARSLAGATSGRLRWFSAEGPVPDGAYLEDDTFWLQDAEGCRPVGRLSDLRLRGRHNAANALAALALADSLAAPAEAMRQALLAFRGVEHRLEEVRRLRGVLYVNDSIATAPERALAALSSFSEPLIMLAGGRDKRMRWEEWARRVNRRVKAVVLFGELGEALAAHLVQAAAESTAPPAVTRADSLAEAVAAAAALAERGDVVLLSPGGTSYDAFADFVERGEAFRRLVHGLT